MSTAGHPVPAVAVTSAARTASGTRAGARAEAATVSRYAFAGVRILLAIELLWAFFDKLFGWGQSTPADSAWVNGGSPTTGFLSHVEGPFGGFFSALAGNVVVDWLFMLGLLGIGGALLLGIGMRVAAATGALLMLMMWLASFPIGTNPFVDAHVIDAVLLVGLAAFAAGDTLGLGRAWSRLSLVERFPVLR